MTSPASISSAPFPSLSGYTFVEQLYLGARTAVYRAVETAQQRSVVLKVIKRDYPSFNELVQFRNQYEITKHLPIPGIISPLCLEPMGSGYALVMEDWGGVALGKYCQQQSLNLTDVLAIGLQLAETLHQLYQHRVIHKDIKPANILIHPESKQVKLIDFSIASRLPKETQAIQNPNTLEGTLAYLAPEQTGRMNRGIDYRADFYALGVTLYQLLTGKLPFTSTDPLELLHCHIAKRPAPVNQVNPEVPERVAAIVLKLMAKNAEDRYQSALGLKHDLEHCLIQWKETGKILAFDLGQQDLSDRFLIPEKLYGRETEVQQLLESFDRVTNGASELMLVAGFSGIGKTAVINEVHKPIARQRGYFIQGKFDQFNRNIPLSAFVQALRDLMGQLLAESDEQLKPWKTNILKALGENGQVLIEVIPELEQIIGQQPAAPELSGSAAQNRFNLLFQQFIEVFTTAEHPLVIFLDDLQWADAASLQLIKLLMDDSGHLLMLGTYRDNEVSPTHPFILTIEALRNAQKIVNTVTLSPLTLDDINHLLADTLQCAMGLTSTLAELIIRKTQGNPFFTTQFLKTLYEEGHISFNHHHRTWECDITQTTHLTLTDDVVDFMAAQLQKLPSQTQQVLKLAACIGNQFDLATLAIVAEQSLADTASDLWQALQTCYVLPTNQIYKFFQYVEQTDTDEAIPPTYRFLHDRVQQAAYALISDDDKQATHLKIGRQLWQKLSKTEQESQLFNIVNHLNIGESLILDPVERTHMAQLNLRASKKAKATVAYETSRRYGYAGQSFLTAESWKNNDSLCFELAIATIEAEFFNHNLEAAEQLSQRILTQAHNLLDQVRVHELQILFAINNNQMNQAISLAIDVLALLEIKLPQDPQTIQAEIESLRQEIVLPIEAIAQLVDLPPLKDETKLASIRILTNASSAAYIANPTLYPMIVLQTVRQCMKYGHSPLAASAYSWYGALLCGLYNEIDAGYAFGQLSLQLLEQFNARALTAKVSNMFNVFIRPWKEPLHNAVKSLPDAIQGGFDNGDVEYAFYAAVHYCNYQFYSGCPLTDVLDNQERYLFPIIKAKYNFHEGFLRINQQVVANLLGDTDHPQTLQGAILDGEKCLSQWLHNNIVFLVLCFYEAQTRLAYLFEDYASALEAGEQGWQYRQAALGTLYVSEQNFYYSLALLATDTLTDQQRDCIAANQAQLKRWAKQSPSNFQHKYELVEAERARIAGDRLKAVDLYDRAIAGAQANGYRQEEALSNERAAKFYLHWGKEKIAQDYLTKAYYGYARWGAKTKVKDLEHRYPQLLSPILQQQTMPLSVTETIFEIEAVSPHQPTSHNSPTSSSTSISKTLDLATILKASQALSSEIQLDKLLSTLLQTVLENAGADKGALIMLHDHHCFVEAVATADQPTQIESTPLDQSQDVPHSLINTVKHSLEPSVIIDAASHPILATDAYVILHRPQSLLCIPILQQGKLVAILYLENRVTTGAFTRDRIELLNILCAQAAISIENARLYQQAQNYSQQLEQSQLQIVQSEKMATLGNLVAGVAHEINNPIGFLNGSIRNGKDYVTDLLKHIALYQQHYPNATEPILDHAEDIDLDFIIEDLPKLLEAMKRATHRMRSISTSLRIFSRADTEHKISINLHEGLESTLLILKYRLKANETRPAIQVNQHFGELPEIKCFPGQLNQVFMNILANAIDALEDSNQGKSYQEIKAAPNKITITTAALKGQVSIRIKDNGIGMPDTVKQRIFDHLYTTKGVGKGTGLGLAIAHQIIVEKHGGQINVESATNQGTEFTLTLPIETLN